MRFGSVCSGIEAASVAWGPLGWQAAWFSEIEPFPSAVLAHHYPETPNLGDMTKLPEMIRRGEVEAPDILCGGTPCQAFSVAGLRRSLDDARGNLSLTFCEIANAIDNAREQPCIVFYENVPGVLSTKDNAFGCFLAGLAGEDEALVPPGGRWTDAGFVDGPQRAVAWRILDAQYFGLAQRRRRVFVVASAREGFDPAAVLLEWEGLRRDSAPSREAGQGAARGAATGAGQRYDLETETILPVGGSGVAHTLGTQCSWATEDGTGRGSPLVPVHRDLAPTLTSNYGKQPDSSDTNAGPMLIPMAVPDVAGTMKACKDSGGWSNSADHAAAGYMVPVAQPYTLAIRGRGDSHQLEYRQDGTANALLTPNGGRGGIGVGAIAHAFDARQSNVIQYGDKTWPLDTDGHSVAVAVRTANTSANGHGISAELAHTLDQAQGQAVAVPMVNMQGSKGNAVVQADGPSFTLNAMHGHDVHAILAPTLTASNDPSRSPQSSEVTAQVAAVVQATAVMQAVAFHENQRAEVTVNDTAGSLKVGGGKPGQGYPALLTAMQVRRLTPVECERLQGFPDGYTAIPWRNKPASECPDGPRYKALGNSWAVPVVRWIGRRIADALA